MEWIKCLDELPQENVEVMTKISDENGERNEQSLKRNGNLWVSPDGSMYVYYTPTHWMPLLNGLQNEINLAYLTGYKDGSQGNKCDYSKVEVRGC